MPATKGINIVAAINLDCIGDDGDGIEGRAVALGSVGKLLLTASVVGQQTHASHPYQGLNAGAMAAALAGRLEGASELADGNGTQAGIPPTLLSIKDSKLQYDVTTPASVFVTWNSLTMGRDASATLQVFRTLACQALEEMQSRQAHRRTQVDGGGQRTTPIDILLVSELFAEISTNAVALDEIAKLATEASAAGHSLPEQNRILTEAAWRLSGRRGPAVILGLGSLPYPPVQLSQQPDANRLQDAIEVASTRAAASSGMSIKLTSFFPGISDMSFIGEAGGEDLATLKANTPAWASGVRWSGQVGGVPVVNIGPWGRDYHTPLERLHTPYAFDVLPGFLLDVVLDMLTDEIPTGR